MSSKTVTAAPELKTLPPTTQCFEQGHVPRAHYQCAIWKSYKEMDPPNLKPEDHAWYFDKDEEIMLPIALPKDFEPAPPEVLQLIKCSCETCSTKRCSCRAARLPCTMFCKCSTNSCNSPYSRSKDDDDDDDDDDNNENSE